jgi:pimeloyl-ACP methyl ester carboxylesterase
MKPVAERREVMTLSAGELFLRGTHHKPYESGEDPGEPAGSRTGVLLLTGLADPRVGCADCAVRWATGLADRGYNCFRVDLPGLGDSDGEVAENEAIFMPLVNSGFFSDSVCVIVDQLFERFHLGRLFLMGHCSGAVTAIYAAAANRKVSGIILLDPYFHLQENEVRKDSILNLHLSIIARLMGSASARAIAVKVHSLARNFYRRRIKALENPNLPLINRWKQLTTRRLPILILRSPSSLPKEGEADFIASLQEPSERKPCVTVDTVAGARHDFAGREARDAVRDCTVEWLRSLQIS